jgi:hypothetical protein
MKREKEIKRICGEVDANPLKMFELIDFLTNNYTYPELVERLAYTTMELYKLNKENQPIPISKEDYLRIRGLFKIRGYKIMPDGTVVEENRGGNRYNKE